MSIPENAIPGIFKLLCDFSIPCMHSYKQFAHLH